MKRNVVREDADYAQAAALLKGARKVGALTGAGISVGSGIPDFRSPGGLWTVFNPDEYATIDVFERNPAKAWKLFRTLGRTLENKKPNPAHLALAELEHMDLLAGMVTQNIDSLHQRAGSKRVYEIHGDSRQLQCLGCHRLYPVQKGLFEGTEIPECPHCHEPLKPNFVLFGEAVRDLVAINDFIAGCDLLLVIGTSARVYPAAHLPAMVWNQGGSLFEFNRESELPDYGHGPGSASSCFFPGDVVHTLPRLVAACRSL